MPVYSTLLARKYKTGPLSAEVLYTAPSTGVVVVRDVVLMHATVGGAAMDLYTVSGSDIAHLLAVAVQPPVQTLHWAGRQVLAPGEQLVLACPATSNIYWRISGYVLGL